MSRLERFSKLLKEEVSDIIREQVSDPRIGFVSVTDVDVSPDLKNAKIYVSVLGDDKQKSDAMEGLTSATGFVRTKLADMLETRSTPEIRFVQDESIERGSRVLGIISKLENEKENLRKNKKRAKKR